MRKKIKVASLTLLIITLLGVAFLFIQNSKGTGPKLSPDQEKVIELMGYPQQFVVTYMEGGTEDKPQLVRDEVWFYTKNGTKVTFLAGKLAYSEDYKPELSEADTKYHPEDFEFIQDYSELEKIVGKGNLYKVEDLPGITDSKDIEVYTSEDIMFLLENGYLTYVQTLVPGEVKNE